MRKLILFLGFLFFAISIFARNNCIPQEPPSKKLFFNFSKAFPNFLSTSEEEALEQKLEQFSNETSNQIVVVIVDDLCGTDANSFATELGHEWKIGYEKLNNGIVVLIKPTGGEGNRDAYIAVGYGLEGIIPDATANQIKNNELIPNLKSKNYFEALNATTDVLISLSKKEYSYSDYQKKNEANNWLPFGIFFIILVFVIISSLRKKSYTVGSGGRTYYGGGWSSWGGGGSWGGGSSGGGFGGFGGGDFGGGGAGGKW